MASTYSTNLAIELIGTGDQAGAWGNTTNTNLGTLIEQAISGYVTQAVSTGTATTITIPNGATGVARNMYIELTGTGGANTFLEVPANKKLYFVRNNTTGAVTVRVAGQTGVSLEVGDRKILVSNGTDIVEATSYIISNGSGNLTTLTVASANITTLTGTTFGDVGTTNLRGVSGNITTLTGTTFGTVGTTQLRGASGVITTLTGTTAAYVSGTIGQFGSTSANITTLTGTTSTYSNLRGTSANITTLTGTNFSATSLTLTNALGRASGGTGVATAPSNGQLLIGNGTGYSLANLGAGTGINITNTAGSITISSVSTLTGVTNSDLTALGLFAGLSITSGNGNTFLGYEAGTAVTTGGNNTMVGYQSGESVSSATWSTMVGFGSGRNVTTGNANTFVGYFAGAGVSTGALNCALGDTAFLSGNHSNSIALGFNAQVSGSNQGRIGDSNVDVFAKSFNNTSDARDKADIQNTNLGLSFIMQLQPRMFRWDMREFYQPPKPGKNATQSEWDAYAEASKLSNLTHNGTRKRNRFHHGLVAQEVKQVMDNMGVDFGGFRDASVNGGEPHMGLEYTQFIAPLIKAIQELKAEFDEYKRTHP